MSRIGKKPITVPAGVEIKIEEGNLVTVKGTKGTLTKKLHDDMIIKLDAGIINVEINNPEQNNLQGLTRTLLNNMIIGVTEGFQKELEIREKQKILHCQKVPAYSKHFATFQVFS